MIFCILSMASAVTRLDFSGSGSPINSPNGLELCCPAEAGNLPLLDARPAGQASSNQDPARRVSISELLGAVDGLTPHRRQDPRPWQSCWRPRAAPPNASNWHAALQPRK